MSEISTTSDKTAINTFGANSFAALRENVTAVILSAQLEKEKARLQGIPFIITRVTYRPGITDNDGNAKDYVSVEAVTADSVTLEAEVKRGRIPNVTTMAELSVEPEEHIVFNDGSTGIRRQLTHMFHNLDIIHVPDVGADMSVFDTPYFEWDSFRQTGLVNGDEEGVKVQIPDITLSPTGAPLAILAGHGLRLSTFVNPANPKTMSEVFYLS